MIQQVVKDIKAGKLLSYEEALQVFRCTSREELHNAAAEITAHFLGNKFDTCSIINAKSGKCSEDCKWCAQSAHYKTKAEFYALLPASECLRQANYNAKQGINRFSLVTSGRKPNTKEMKVICDTFHTIKANSSIKCCASLGLLTKEELTDLRAAGVENYHCNIETSPSYFKELCSTHTMEEKMKTIRAAREVGMRICSGGIIGMGETMEQRIEMAVFLQENEVYSIPINMLHPIEGTPLGKCDILDNDEFLDSVAMFRLINPKAYLRFSGGRALLSKDTQAKALRIGINSAIMGDLLTTIGSKVKEDIELFTEAGYTFNENTDWVK